MISWRSFGVFWATISLAFEACAVSPPNLSNIFINEISTTGWFLYRDEDGEQSEWIEVYNPTASSVSLAGYYLTDATGDLTQWPFPDVTLQSGEYLLVYASGKDRSATDGSNLHANFRLDSEGEYLAIVDSASQVVNALAPSYPPQSALFSYGYDSNANAYRFMNFTPGASNELTEAFDGFLENSVDFSVERGYYDAPFTVELSTQETGAVIRYTTDASTPGWATGTVYAGPISIDKTTVLRAVALVPGVGLSKVQTHTYFIGLSEELKALPALSLVTDEAYWDDPVNGIRINYGGRGRRWERPVSAEYVDPLGGPEFQVNCGVRLHGLGSRTPPKQSMRLYFRSSYGQDRLRFPFIPESSVTSFKRLVLRAGWQDRDPFISDELVRRLAFDMGHFQSRGTFVQVFINGEYLGFYNPCERLDEFFFESWEGNSYDWDIIQSRNELFAGDRIAWDELYDLARAADLSGVLNEADYEEIKTRLDVTDFIDDIFIHIEGAVNDWPYSNWVAAKERIPGAKFRYYIWDAEQTFGRGRGFLTNTIATQVQTDNFNPDEPVNVFYRGLRANEGFRKLFAARYRKQFYGDGALTDSHVMEKYLQLKGILVGAFPTMRNLIAFDFIPGRRHNVENFLDEADLLDRTGLPAAHTVVVNEFMAQNVTTISDEEDDFDDWIEIYNTTDAVADLSGMYLTDDFEFPQKWQFPTGTTIDPFGYLLLWADGEPTEGDLHTSFRLDGDGEQIGIFDTDINDNVLIDSVVYDEQEDDVSYGRTPDGFGRFAFQQTPSPGGRNDTVPFLAHSEFGYTKYNVGRGGKSIVSADFNKDGFADLAFANFDYGTVAVLKSHGDGTFGEPAIRSAGRVGTAALAAGDFDGDGNTDLVAANDFMLEYTVSVLLNDGTGSFHLHGVAPFNASPETRNLHPRSILPRDMDGDGDLDLLVQSESSAIPGGSLIHHVLAVMVNDGDGNFTETGGVEGGYVDQTGARGFVAEDFNKDGAVDLATLARIRLVSIQLNDGAGGFSAATDIQIPGSSFAKAWAIDSADLDGDGDVDLVVCDGAGMKVHVLANDGSGGFSLATGLAASVYGAVNLVVGDFNGDGWKDVAVGNKDSFLLAPAPLQILFNKGNGSFEVSDPFFTADEVPFPRLLAAGDFNFDGNGDLAVLDEFNGTLSVFTNLRSFGPQPSSVNRWEEFR